MKLRSLIRPVRHMFARGVRRKVREVEEYRQLPPKELFDEKFSLMKESAEDSLANLSEEEKELFEKGFDIMRRMSEAEREYLLYKIMKEDNLYKGETVQTNELLKSTPHNSFNVYRSNIFSSFGSGQTKAESTTDQVAEEIVEEPQEESKVVNLCLESFDAAQKLKIIKELKAILGLGLKETKELLEKGPGVLKEKVNREEAEQIQEKLTKLGCVTILK